MKPRHIPGPWEASDANAIWAVSPWNARVCIANVTTFSPMNGIDSAANARLIAAAPSLLGTLRKLLARAERELADPEDVPEIDAARAAISMATGGSA